MKHTMLKRFCLAMMAAVSLLCLPAHGQVEISDPPVDHNFGKIPLGATFATQYFSLTNSGSTPVQIGEVKVDAIVTTCAGIGCPVIAPAEFHIQTNSNGCDNAILQPGQGCSTLVNFTPVRPGARLAGLKFPVVGMAAPVTRLLQGTGTAEPTDCVFDWAERVFPDALTTPTGTFTVEPFYARCYANGTVCLGTDSAAPTFDQPSVYIYQPQATPPLFRVDYLSTYAELAQCQ